MSRSFAADLPKAQVDFLAHAQTPVAGAAFSAKMPVAAWHDKASYAVIATRDRVLDIERAKWMAQRAGSKVTFVNASHAVLISQPRAVAALIEAAARSVQQSSPRTIGGARQQPPAITAPGP